MARMKGGLANLIPSVDDGQVETPGESPDDTHLSVVTPTRSDTDVPEPATAPTILHETPAPPAEAKAPAKPKKAPAKKTAPSRARKPATPVLDDDLVDADLPRYLQLERKDVRMRSDQLDALTNLSRRLNKQRRGRGERITENTLVRVAIDLLMNQTDELGGFTEDELRSSLGV